MKIIKLFKEKQYASMQKEIKSNAYLVQAGE